MTIREHKKFSPDNMTHITDTKRAKTDIADCMHLMPNYLNCDKVNMCNQQRFMDTRASMGICHSVITMINKINPQKMEMNPVITMDTQTRMVGTDLTIQSTPSDSPESQWRTMHTTLKIILEMHIPCIRTPYTPSAYTEQTEHPTFRVKSNP